MAQVDETTLNGFREGNPQAVAVVVDKYYEPLLNFLIRLGCPKRDAEDMVQECFIKAGRGLHNSYQHRSRFRAWLFRIAKNTFNDYVKKHPSEGSFRRIPMI